MKTKNDPMDSKYIKLDHLDKIGEVALYYGFTPAKSPQITKADLDIAKEIMEGDFINDETCDGGRLPLHAEEKISLIRTYSEENMHTLPQPVMLYFKDPCRACAHSGRDKRVGYPRYADLEILGSSGPIAEATLIQTARAMIAEEGYAETSVHINSIGDRESINRFVRELTSYYRKNIGSMSTEDRQLFKKDPFELLSSNSESSREINAKAPKSMNFLSESSKRHLEEVLEYLETLDIPYVIDNSLLGNRKYCTETVFSIINASGHPSKSKEQSVLAVGVRYNGLAKRMNARRDIQGVGMSILIKGTDKSLRKTITKSKRPIASFVQLGSESKLMSLGVIETLRKVRVPLQLCLAKDRLGAQVSSVEKYHAPYVIVMGKKEAVEKTAIVRENETHSQNIVPIDDLAKYMKKLEERHWK